MFRLTEHLRIAFATIVVLILLKAALRMSQSTRHYAEDF